MQLPPKFPGGLLIARLPAYLHVTSVSLSRSMSEAQAGVLTAALLDRASEFNAYNHG